MRVHTLVVTHSQMPQQQCFRIYIQQCRNIQRDRSTGQQDFGNDLSQLKVHLCDFRDVTLNRERLKNNSLNRGAHNTSLIG